MEIGAGAIEVQETLKDPFFFTGKVPIGLALVQVGRHEALEEGMDQVICVLSFKDKPAVPGSQIRPLFLKGRSRLADGLRMGKADRPKSLGVVIPHLAFYGPSPPSGLKDILPDPPVHGVGRNLGHALQEPFQSPGETVQAGKKLYLSSGAQGGIQFMPKVGFGDPTFIQTGAVGFLGKVRLGPKEAGGLLHRVLEGLVLEEVEGIVMDELLDGSLRGEQVGDLLDRLGEIERGRGQVPNRSGVRGCL